MDLVFAVVGAIIVVVVVVGVLARPNVELDEAQARREKLLGVIWMLIAVKIGVIAILVTMSYSLSNTEVNAVIGFDRKVAISQLFGDEEPIAILHGPFTVFYLFMATGILSAIGGALYVRGKAMGTMDYYDVGGGLSAIVFPAFLPMLLILTMYSEQVRTLAGSEGMFYLDEASWLVMMTEYASNLYVSVLFAFIVALIIDLFVKVDSE